MKNGPELWDKILSHFPEGSIIAGGAIRDYLLGLEPKDFDVFGPYATYNAQVEGMEHLTQTSNEEHEEEYLAMREIAIVMKGEIEGVKVDYIGMHIEDPVVIVEAFDTGINQLFYGNGILYKKKAHVDDVANKTVTVTRADRLERTKERFERFNKKAGGEYTLIIPENLEAPIVTRTEDFQPLEGF